MRKLLSKFKSINRSDDPIIIRKRIWNELRKQVKTDGDGLAFLPFKHLRIVVYYETDLQKAALAAIFCQDDGLGNYLLNRLAELGYVHSGKLRIAVELSNAPEMVDQSERFRFILMDEASAPVGARLRVLSGKSDKRAYRLTGEKVHIGRLKDVRDADGRIVRLNHVIFAETEDTISRMHCSIRFDADKNNFVIRDEQSAQGTRINRGGEFKTLPPNIEVVLKEGDLLHLGRAIIKFGLADGKNQVPANAFE